MAEALSEPSVEAPPEGLWARLRADPEHAAEVIALAAAGRFEQPARRWAALMLPGHEPAEAARTARRKHVHMARLGGAATGVGGAFTAPADVVSLLWIQSRMVFFVAASYGFDPGEPMRPAELLALQGVYPTAAEARAGLDGMGRPIAVAVADRTLRSGGDEQIARRLVGYAGRKMAKHTALRMVPLIASPIGAVQNARAAAALGDRALRYYGG
jgi:uncharacterized protein (DUF697 family)